MCGYKVKEEHIPAITTAATATTTSVTAQRNSTNTSTITVITKLPLPRPVCRERKKVIKDEGELARFKDTENKHCGQDNMIHSVVTVLRQALPARAAETHCLSY